MHSPHFTRPLLLTGIAGPLLFSLMAVATAALRSNYDHVDQFISELGETGGEFAWLMNYFGFMLSATLILIFVITFQAQFPRTAANAIGTFFLAMFAIGMFFAGVYSCDPGCPVTNLTPEQKLHDVASIALPAFTLGVAAWGVFFFQVPEWRRFGVYSLVTVLLSIVVLVAMVQSETLREGTGVYQRLFLGVLFVWMIALAVLLRTTADNSDSRETG